MILCEPGDILLFRDSNALTAKLIKTGERLEDPDEPNYYFHVAIALDANSRIETNGTRVHVMPIGSDFDVFRPPVPQYQIAKGLYSLRHLIGQPYDWFLIIDEALRDLTHNLIHLPEKFIQSKERREKICSTLVASYFSAAQWGALKRFPRPSPEDIYLLVKDYQVK